MRNFWMGMAVLSVILAPVMEVQGQSTSSGKYRVVTLHPTAAPEPALKFALLPRSTEILPGNAAYLYQRAHSPEWYMVLQRNKDFQRFHEVLEGPLDKVDRKLLDQVRLNSGMLAEIDRGARSEYCDWGWVGRIRESGISLLLPDVQSFRTYGRLLSMRTRLALVDRRFDEAIHSLRTTFALSKHVGDAPILINYLVGAAVCNMGLDRVEDWVQQPNSPNLYWALTDLPRPLLDLRRSLHGEELWLDNLFPGIRQAIEDPNPAAMTADAIRERVKHLQVLGSQDLEPIALAFQAARTYPAARAYFLKRGRKAEQLDKLPVMQVVLMYSVAEIDRIYDDFIKNANLPFREARKGMQKASRELGFPGKDSPGSFLARLLVPSTGKVHEVQFRLHRRIALLRTVEAIRLHAFHNGGKLPEDLEEIRVVPVPTDPWTGKAFVYIREGARARLHGASFNENGGADDPYAIRVELVLGEVEKK